MVALPCHGINFRLVLFAGVYSYRYGLPMATSTHRHLGNRQYRVRSRNQFFLVTKTILVENYPQRIAIGLHAKYYFYRGPILSPHKELTVTFC